MGKFIKLETGDNYTPFEDKFISKLNNLQEKYSVVSIVVYNPTKHEAIVWVGDEGKSPSVND